jgi:uncharacterized protein
MNILIDIGHPAHFHYWRNFAKIFLDKGSNLLFTFRDKEITKDLLECYDYDYVCLGKPYSGIKNKLKGLITFNYKLLKTARAFKPDIFLSAGSPYAAMVSSLMRKPHISLEDTFNFEQIRIYLPFTNTVLTANYSHPSLGKKEIMYSGYQELAYLHPEYFIPDINILSEIGVKRDEKYVVLRFVSWQATHDMGHKGISMENKIKAVYEFNKSAKVFISSENELPRELASYKLNIAPNRMHDVIAFSTLLYGESATMASEAAMMGVPAIYLDNIGRYYTREQEKKYGLVFNYSESKEDQLLSVNKAMEIIQSDYIKEDWQIKKQKMLSEKINVTDFLVWFVENYPKSFSIMKKDPEYQLKFK